jgi:Bifunctional DNA primase/polymerase, N-terminal/D5 N terminal like
MTTPLEAARAYLAQGWFPIPVPWRQKAPLLDGWLQLRLTAKTVADYFNGSPQNVGILLGQLTDVDCDAPEAIAGAPEYLPPTPAIHGRPSKRRSHWWYRRAQAQPTVQFRNTDTTMLVELRGEGGHTLVWPSVHPSGEPITWEGQGDPAQVDAHELEVAVTRLAAMALLARHWPKQAGSRHQLALSLAGFLLRGELDEELSARVIGSAARIAKDPEWRDRIMAVRTTARRLAAGEACVTTFERVIPDGAVIQGLLTPWLRLRVPHPRLTDLGNAERFIAQHGEDVRYCYPFRSWFVWNGTRWWKDPGDAITRLGKATVRTIYSEAADARDPEDRKAIVAWALKSESAERLRACSSSPGARWPSSPRPSIAIRTCSTARTEPSSSEPAPSGLIAARISSPR